MSLYSVKNFSSGDEQLKMMTLSNSSNLLTYFASLEQVSEFVHLLRADACFGLLLAAFTHFVFALLSSSYPCCILRVLQQLVTSHLLAVGVIDHRMVEITWRDACHSSADGTANPSLTPQLFQTCS